MIVPDLPVQPVRHSFAVRRAVTTKVQVYAKTQEFVQAVQWFKEHLGDG
jgi:hypothetical protein